MIVVCDSSMLITLSLINQLRLLSQMFGGVFIPQGVYHEVVIRGAGKVGAEEVENADFIHVEQIQNREAIDEYVDPLSQIDAEVIALAKEQASCGFDFDPRQTLAETRRTRRVCNDETLNFARRSQDDGSVSSN